MGTPVRRVVHVNRTLVISLLAGFGVALSCTYWWSQPGQKGELLVSQRSDYPTEWLGI